MNEPKLTQTLEFFKIQLEIFLQNQIDKTFHPNLIDTKMLQYRVKILIDRVTDIMGDDEFRHTIQMSARVVKEIARLLDEIYLGDKDFKPVSIKSFLDKGLRLAKYDIMQMNPQEILDAL